MTKKKAKGGWSADEIAAYGRFLAEREGWELEQEEMARLSAEVEELRQDLEAIALQHLGRVWLGGLASRLALDRRHNLKEKLLGNLRNRYDKIFAKKRAAGLDEKAAHRATLCALRGLSIKLESFTSEALRKGPKPRSCQKQLPKLLAAFERWLPKVRAEYPKIRQAGDPQAELLGRIPEASKTRPSDRTIDGKVVPPFKLAALLACGELGIHLSLKRAQEEIWRQRKAGQGDPMVFTDEEVEKWAKKDKEEGRLRALRDRFGPPPGLPDLWA